MQKMYFKVITLLLLCVGIIINSKAQVKTKIFKEVIPTQLIPVSKMLIPEKVISAPLGFTQLLKKTESMTEKYTEYINLFAVPAEVDLDVLANANVTEENGVTTFALKINAEKALNISLQFNKFILPENSILSIYTDRELTDSITANENNENKIWATRVYQGNKLTMVLKLPTKEKSQVTLNISRVYFGFKKIGSEYFGTPGSSGACNINVLCPQGNAWQNERNSVALIIANGGTATGAPGYT